jgi:hypothetical protein
MTLEDRVQAQRLHVFRRAEELGNVDPAGIEALQRQHQRPARVPNQ